MKFKPTIIGEASGSVGSLTFSHNRGGQYIRQRSVPVNPASAFQVAVRNSMADLTSKWLDTLTAAQRAAWDTYSTNVPLPDALGEPRNAGGVAMYCRSNIPILQAGLPRVDDAPVIFNLGEVTAPSVSAISAAADTVDVAFEATDAWANEDDAALLILASRPQNASINYFAGPYRFAGSVLGDSVTPPTSPATLSLPFPVAVGNQVFFQARAVRADGRLTSAIRFRGVAA